MACWCMLVEFQEALQAEMLDLQAFAAFTGGAEGDCNGNKGARLK